jgi:RecB family exonuclease
VLELIGLREDLVAATADAVLEQRAGNDLSAVAVAFPSRRFGFFLRQELARRLDGNFFPPAMYPVKALFDALYRLNFPGVRTLNGLEAAHALFESAQALFPSGMYGAGRPDDFSSFLPWAQKVLEALEEIQSEGGAEDDLDWESYEQFTGLGEYHRPYKEFIQRLPALLQDLRQRLQQRRQATQGMAWRAVADGAESGGLLLPAARAWILSGFNAANACERRLFRFLGGQPGARFILRGDRASLGDPHSPFHLQAETLLALGLDAPPAPAAPAPSLWDGLAGRVSVHPCDGVESQVYFAFRELERICRGRSEDELRRVAVMLPAPGTLIPFVQGAVSRFDQERSPLPFNITLGYPFSRTPMMQLIESLLILVEKWDGGVVAAEDYLALVRHPYVKISGERGGLEPLKRGIHAIEDIISRRNLIRFTVADLELALEATLLERGQEEEAGMTAAIRAEIGAMHARFIPPAPEGVDAFLAFLRRAVASIAGPANRGAHLFLNEYAAEALLALEELAAFAAAHGEALGRAGSAGMAALVRAHFRNRAIGFEGSPLKGIQVMGPLEFRGLSFDEVIVLDALEGVLPGTAKYDPILPADIRAVFKIRDHGDWEKIYAFNFFAMLGASGRAHLFTPRSNEEGRDRERSRFIERIAYEVEKAAGRPLPDSSGVLPFGLGERALRQAEKTPAVRARLEALPLSPSSLATYVSCPLRFYHQEILDLGEREALAGESEGGAIGRIVHQALRRFYDARRDAAALEAVPLAELERELEGLVDAAFRELHFDPRRGLEKIRAWTVKEQLRRFLHQDLARLRENDIRVQGLEAALAMELEVPGRARPATVHGRLDRWEQEGNRLRILDYKTGRDFATAVDADNAPDLSDLARRPDAESLKSLAAFRRRYPGMQLQIYLLLLARESGLGWEDLDAAYVFLRRKEKPMVQGIFRSGGRSSRPLSGGEQARFMESFRSDLGEVLRDLFSRERFLADRSDGAYCAHCPFRLPCGNL